MNGRGKERKEPMQEGEEREAVYFILPLLTFGSEMCNRVQKWSMVVVVVVEEQLYHFPV